MSRSHGLVGYLDSGDSTSSKPRSKSRRATLVFQVLLFCSILFSIAAGLYAGALPALVVATVFSILAFTYHVRELGFERRALLACLLFYLLSLFFISARFLTSLFSFAMIPFVALAFSALILAFRFLVFNRSGEGVVLERQGRFILIEVSPSPWHSLSGVQVFEGNSQFSQGAGVKLQFKSSLFSPLRISRVYQ